MKLVLRQMVWSDGRHSIDPEDYRIFDGDDEIGRVYRTKIPEGVGWLWTI